MIAICRLVHHHTRDELVHYALKRVSFQQGLGCDYYSIIY